MHAKYKQTVTQQELQTFEPDNPNTAETKQIKVPSFLINGTEELFFCGDDLPESKNGNEFQPETEPLGSGYYCGSDQDLTEFEGQYFDKEETCFTAGVVPKTGHIRNLHKSAQKQFQISQSFADRANGSNGGKVGEYCATSTSLSE